MSFNLAYDSKLVITKFGSKNVFFQGLKQFWGSFWYLLYTLAMTKITHIVRKLPAALSFTVGLAINSTKKGVVFFSDCIVKFLKTGIIFFLFSQTQNTFHVA